MSRNSSASISGKSLKRISTASSATVANPISSSDATSNAVRLPALCSRDSEGQLSGRVQSMATLLLRNNPVLSALRPTSLPNSFNRMLMGESPILPTAGAP